MESNKHCSSCKYFHMKKDDHTPRPKGRGICDYVRLHTRKLKPVSGDMTCEYWEKRHVQVKGTADTRNDMIRRNPDGTSTVFNDNLEALYGKPDNPQPMENN